MFMFNLELTQTYFITHICLIMIGSYLTTITTGTVGDTLTLGQETLVPGYITVGIIVFFILNLSRYVIKDIMNQDQYKDKE